MQKLLKHNFIKHATEEQVRKTVKRGANPNAKGRNPNYDTPLHKSVDLNNAQAFFGLLKSGANFYNVENIEFIETYTENVIKKLLNKNESKNIDLSKLQEEIKNYSEAYKIEVEHPDSKTCIIEKYYRNAEILKMCLEYATKSK